MSDNAKESPKTQNKQTDFKSENLYSVYKDGKIFATAEPYGSLIGRGTYSKVYKGVLHGGGRTVTIKVHTRPLLRPTKKEQDAFSEVQTKVEWLTKLTHPRIADFIDWIPDFQNNRSFIIMQYIEGRGLNQELADKGSFSQARVLNWAFQLLDAMKYLHKKRYIIGDLDPSNIVLTPEGDVCLVDFKYVSDIRDAFRENITKYHGGYGDSPEEDKTLKAGIREDIWHLGATMFELLTGENPEGLSVENQKKALNEKGVVASVTSVIFKAMSPEAEKRYASAAEMEKGLQRLTAKDKHARSQIWSLILVTAFILVLFLTGWRSFSKGQYQIARYAEMKTEADDSSVALLAGNYTEALSCAKEATRQEDDDLPCPPEAQAALADAVSAYDYVAGYKPYHSDFKLRGRPLNACFSTDGDRIAVLVEEANVSPPAKRIQVFEVQSAAELVSFPASYSSLSTFAFLDNDTILYAGEIAVKCYSISEKKELWSGPTGSADKKNPVSVAVSADGKTAASVCWGNPYAYIYNTENALSEPRYYRLNRPGKDAEANTFDKASMSTRDNLFALSYDGRYLSVSFPDGGAGIYDLNAQTPEDGYHELIDSSSYLHFEGGFCRRSGDKSGEDWFFYAASTTDQPSTQIPVNSQSGLIRLSDMEQTLSLERYVPIHMQADQNGIYLSVGDWLYHANIDEPDSVFWEYLAQAEGTIRLLRHAAGRILAVTENELVLVYHDDGAWKVDIAHGPFSIAGLSEQYVFLATQNKAMLSILRWTKQGEEILSYNTDSETDEASYYAPLGAHVHTDGRTAMLYRSTGFRIYNLETGRRVDKALEEDETSFGRVAERLIYQREQALSDDPTRECLKVIYENDVEFYSANGEKLSAFSRERRAEDENVKFLTHSYHVKQNGGGSVEIYSTAKPDKLLKQWQEGTLTYASQTGDYLILSIVDEESYSLLLDKNLDVIAKLPEPCEALPDDAALPVATETESASESPDIQKNGTLIFNDMQGHLLQGSLYTLESLRSIANNWRNETG